MVNLPLVACDWVSSLMLLDSFQLFWTCLQLLIVHWSKRLLLYAELCFVHVQYVSIRLRALGLNKFAVIIVGPRDFQKKVWDIFYLQCNAKNNFVRVVHSECWTQCSRYPSCSFLTLFGLQRFNSSLIISAYAIKKIEIKLDRWFMMLPMISDAYVWIILFERFQPRTAACSLNDLINPSANRCSLISNIPSWEN